MEPWKYGLSKPPHELMGEYWAKDNAAFEKTDPAILERMRRYVNPIIGFGSAVGSVYSRAREKDIPGVALGFAEGLPMGLLAGRGIQVGRGLIKSHVKPFGWNDFSKAVALTTGIGATGDFYDNPIDISFGSKSFVSKEGGSYE